MASKIEAPVAVGFKNIKSRLRNTMEHQHMAAASITLAEEIHNIQKTWLQSTRTNSKAQFHGRNNRKHQNIKNVDNIRFAFHTTVPLVARRRIRLSPPSSNSLVARHLLAVNFQSIIVKNVSFNYRLSPELRREKRPGFEYATPLNLRSVFVWSIILWRIDNFESPSGLVALC